MVQVIDIDRAVIVTRDIEKSVAQFERLGLTFGEELTFEVGDEPISARVEEHGIDFITPEKEGEISRYLDETGPGLYALSLRVDDAAAARDRLAEDGVEPVKAYKDGPLEEYFYHPSDFSGVLLIVCEYDAPHPLEASLEML